MTGRPTGRVVTHAGPEPSPDAGAGERDRAHPDDLSARTRILDAAERLFAERGFDRTSTARIAAAAGVPHGLIFYHFKTKMDLLLAVVRDSEVIVLDDLLPCPQAGADLRQAIAEIWRQLSIALGQPSTVRRIIFQEIAAHPEVRQRAAVSVTPAGAHGRASARTVEPQRARSASASTSLTGTGVPALRSARTSSESARNRLQARSSAAM